MVYIAESLVTKKRQKKLFQLDMKVLMAITARTVLARGRMIRVKICSWLQPSILALSIRGVGRPEKNCLHRKML